MSDLETATIPAWLDDIAARCGGRPALGDVDGNWLDFAALRTQALDVAAAVSGAGLGPGDVVLVAMHDGPMALIAFLGAASVAAAFPVAAQGSADDYRRWIAASGASAIIMEERPDAPLTALAGELGLPLIVVRSALNSDDVVLSATHDGAAAGPPPSDEAIAALTLTSGTEATPKLVASTHRSLCTSFREFGRGVGLRAGDLALCVMPFVHLHSLVRTVLPVLDAGGRVIWAPGFDRGNILSWLEKLRPSFMTAVPTIYRVIFEQMAESGWTLPAGSMRLAGAGSDRVDTDILEGIRTHLGARPFQFYGMTETCPYIAMTPTSGDQGPAGTTGRINPAWQVRVVDADGHDVQAGAEGEIVVRGGIINPVVTGDGARQPDAADSWKHTGDVGRIAGDFLTVTGRLGDRITRGGKKVEPAVVEHALTRHPAVGEVVVFGLPDPTLGQRIAAVVVPATGALLDPDDVKAFAGQHLSADNLPDKIIVASEIPRTDRGKISRAGLAKAFGAALAQAASSPASENDATGAHEDTLQTALLQVLRTAIGHDALGADEDFFDAGGDSFGAVTAVADIETTFGVSLSPQAFRTNASAAKLADLVRADKRSEAPYAELVTIRATGSLPPLFLAHGVDGQNGYALPIADGLGPEQPVYTFNCRGPRPSEAPLSLKDHAAILVDLMKAAQPEGPYHLAGYSYGAHLAYTMAQLLLAHGDEVGFLAIIDDEADLEKRNFGIAQRNAPGDYVYSRNYWALQADTKQPLKAPIFAFLATDGVGGRRSDPALGWGYLADGFFQVTALEGDHFSIVEGNGISTWIARLAAALELARTGKPRGQKLGHAKRSARKQVLAALEHGKHGRLEDEIACYRKACAIREQPFWVYGNYAEALFQSGDIAAGDQAYQKAVAADPWPLTSFRRFAPVLGDMGLQARYTEAVNQGVGFPIDGPDAARDVAMLYQMSGQPYDAERSLDKGVKLAPRSFPTLMLRADLAIARKSYEAAVRDLRAALDIYAGDWVSNRELGYALFKSGATEEGEQKLRQAIKLNPSHAKAYDFLAELLTATDREAEARSLLENRPPD